MAGRDRRIGEHVTPVAAGPGTPSRRLPTVEGQPTARPPFAKAGGARRRVIRAERHRAFYHRASAATSQINRRPINARPADMPWRIRLEPRHEREDRKSPRGRRIHPGTAASLSRVRQPPAFRTNGAVAGVVNADAAGVADLQVRGRSAPSAFLPLVRRRRRRPRPPS
ncbi:hypothetical protein ACPA9J_27120 [Pseudomonas aeruginosa]